MNDPWPGHREGLTNGDRWPRDGQYERGGGVRAFARSSVWPPPEASYLTLRLDPSRSSKVASKRVTAERIETKEHTKAKKRLWNTPRWGKTGGCKTLTVRSERDLPTTVYFEEGTPYCPTGVLNPSWTDWLMGYPPGFSDHEASLAGSPPLPCPSRPRSRLKCLDVFSGMGGISWALRPWFETVGYCDVNPHSREVLAARVKDGSIDEAPIFTDILELNAGLLGAEVDAICGGFPCTGLSQAGKREGMANKQTHLFYEMLRLIDELDVQVAFLENVANITSPSLKSELDVVMTAMVERGFHCRYVTLQATDVGACQTRRRWFMFATRSTPDPPTIP